MLNVAINLKLLQNTIKNIHNINRKIFLEVVSSSYTFLEYNPFLFCSCTCKDLYSFRDGVNVQGDGVNRPQSGHSIK